MIAAIVTQILDGDTARMQVGDILDPVKVRFASIDCPEKNQTFGAEASTYVQKRLQGQTVHIRSYGYDIHQRLLVDVFMADGSRLNETLVREGYCWAYYPRQVIFKTLQARAQAAHAGLWALPDPIAPWDFRKLRMFPAPRIPVAPHL